MTDKPASTQALPFRAVLTPHRSLGPKGFVILMSLFGFVCFATGLAFYLLGAWPVFAFFGLDVLLLYAAFKLNYRSGHMVETIEITPVQVTLSRRYPSGRQEAFDCNPFYARVNLEEWPDGRTHLSLAARGKAIAIAGFLNDEEKRDLAGAISNALAAARGARI